MLPLLVLVASLDNNGLDWACSMSRVRPTLLLACFTLEDLSLQVSTLLDLFCYCSLVTFYSCLIILSRLVAYHMYFLGLIKTSCSMLIVPAFYFAGFDLMGPVIYFCMLYVLFQLLSPQFQQSLLCWWSNLPWSCDSSPNGNRLNFCSMAFIMGLNWVFVLLKSSSLPTETSLLLLSMPLSLTHI